MKRLCLLFALVVAAGATAASASASGPLQTAVFDPDAFRADPVTAFDHVVDAGAGAVRILVVLDGVAPRGVTKPASFDPTDPSSVGWNFNSIDAQVQQAVAHGLTPILCLFNLPAWAGGTHPNTALYGRLAEGVARRYSGTFGSLPRVENWQAWNEPNLGTNLTPQRGAAGLLSPNTYRTLVNAFARGVKRVHADNLVIAGGLAPYAATTGPGIPPLTFMKQFLCLTGFRIRARPNCVQRATFDVWAMQPYTWGGPTHHATVAGDIALGDLPSMKSALDQAEAARKIVSTVPVQFWVTEFSWDTNPPDPGGVAIGLQTRWTAQALYTMWQNGVSLVTWFLIRDQPFPSRWQSGLYFDGATMAADTPKPTLEAFRFPTVAFPEGVGIRVWCRTPKGTPGVVTFEQNTGAGWLPLGAVVTDGDGIVWAVLPSLTPTAGSVRAVFQSEPSQPFSLTDVPDQSVDPFGN
jgi:hypothetical protein